MVSAPPGPPGSPGLSSEKAATEGSGELPLEGALRLVGGTRNEERVLGVTLALHHSELLSRDAAPRAQLLAALDPAFVCQLLRSAPALRRVAIAALRILLVDPPAAAKLGQCAAALAQACITAGAAEAEVEEAERAERVGEVVQASEALRQLLRLRGGPGGAARSETAAAAAAALLEALSPGGALATWHGEAGVAEAALALAQEVTAAAHACGGARSALAPARRVVEGTCLDRRLRGSPAHLLALGLLAELVEAGAAPACLDEALGEAVAAGVAARPAALLLAAAALSTCGLSFGQRGGPRFARLRPLLELAAGELRLGLEGHAPRENLYAACAALEAAAVALGREAEALEASASLQEASDCLRQIHKAIAHVHDYCADLSPEGDPPVELALVARLAAAWQLEDPRQFSVEFQRSLPAFCALPPADFAVLLPCIQETYDWHLTPALGAVLRTALAAAGAEASLPDAAEVWRQAAGMLTEVALDAAAYLPEAPLCAPPKRLLEGCRGAAGAAAAAPPVQPVVPSRMPRPVPAAEPTDHGVQRLCDWSCVLWAAGAATFASEGHRRWELGVVCGALLVSVPEAAVTARPEVVSASAGAWAATASCLFAGPQAEAPTWRLAMRLAGFALDRHGGLAAALAAASAAQPRPGAAPVPPPGAAPGRGAEDEWAVADTSAAVAVSDFLVAVSRVPAWMAAPAVGTSPAAVAGAAGTAGTASQGAGSCLGDMD